jgi:tetratricopeptide (TPR) repeat protein
MQLFQDGRRREALAAFETAAEAFGRTGDVSGQAEIYNNIGVINRLQRNWRESKEALQRAQAAFAQLGECQQEAVVLANLGDLYAATGDRARAGECYGQAAEQFAAVGDRQKQAEVLRTFSLMHLRQRDWFGSVDLMTASLEARPGRSLGQHLFYWLLRLVRRWLIGS